MGKRQKSSARPRAVVEHLIYHLIHGVLDLTEVEVISATRIPETKADDRNRMMIVSLSNGSMRGKVLSLRLRVAKKLREKEEWKHVFISADHTKREWEKHCQLRKELRERREMGEKNVFIQKGHIVESGDTKKQDTQPIQVKDTANRSPPGRTAEKHHQRNVTARPHQHPRGGGGNQSDATPHEGQSFNYGTPPGGAVNPLNPQRQQEHKCRGNRR